MKKEPQIFTTINVQDVPVSSEVMDTLEQEEVVRECVRRMLAEELLAEGPSEWIQWAAQPFSVLLKNASKFVTGPIDDALDQVIQELAPQLVAEIQEREIDEDIDEFIEGALHGDFDAMQQDFGDPPEVTGEITEDYVEGYSWAFANPGKIEEGQIPDSVRQEMVIAAHDALTGRVTEEAVIDAMESAWHHLNPMNVVRLLMKAWVEKDWKLGVKLFLFEVTEHTLVPAVAVALTGNPAWAVLGTIPFGEVLIPVWLAITGAEEDLTPDEDGHLDWYREKFGRLPSLIPAGVGEGHLREYVRGLLIEQDILAQGMCFPFAYQKAEEWFEAHFTRGVRGRSPKRHPDLNDKSKFKVVHGTVTDKWIDPPKPVVHGWVEMGDLVFDDQSRHTKPGGVEREFYYDMYQPVPTKEFTAEDAIVNCIKYGGEGPWDDDLYAQLQQRDAWINESDLNESAVRDYIRQLLMEQEVKFSGILKLMPTPNVKSIISSLLPELVKAHPDAVPLEDDRFHVTLAHQSVLKPYRKELKQLAKDGMLPPAPLVDLESGWEMRPRDGMPNEDGRKSWVVWVKNQGAFKKYIQDVIQLAGGPSGDPEPSRRFHISIANLTGNPGDSVR